MNRDGSRSMMWDKLKFWTISPGGVRTCLDWSRDAPRQVYLPGPNMRSFLMRKGAEQV